MATFLKLNLVSIEILCRCFLLDRHDLDVQGVHLEKGDANEKEKTSTWQAQKKKG